MLDVFALIRSLRTEGDVLGFDESHDKHDHNGEDGHDDDDKTNSDLDHDHDD